MMRNFRKAISIVCVIAILMSLCVISMVENTAAIDTVNYGTSVKLDFNNEKGLAASRNGLLNDKLKFAVPTGEDASNKALLIKATMGSEPVAIPGSTNTSEYFTTSASNLIMQAGVTYKLTYKWKAKAGYVYSTASADRYRKSPISFLGINVLDVPAGTNVTNANTYTALGNGTANPVGVKSREFVVDATNGTQSTANAEFWTLDADSPWFTETATFTWTANAGESLGFWINAGTNTASMPGNGIREVYIDDVTITVINSGSTAVKEINIDHKANDSGAVVDYKNHTALANSTSDKYATYPTWKSYADNNSVLHITTYQHSSFSKTGLAWENQYIVYDPDISSNNGYLKLKSGKTYMVSFQYKVSASKKGGGQVGVGYAEGLTGGDKSITIANSAFVACTNTDPTVESGEWQNFNVAFDATSAMNDKYLNIIASTANGAVSGANADRLTKVLIKSINIKEFSTADMVTVNFDTNGGNAVDALVTEKGTNVFNLLPIPTNSDTNKSFGGWYKDAAFTQPVETNWAPATAGTVTLYARWSSLSSSITFNNAGVVTTSRLAKDTPLARPERPNGQLFFEGWYTEPTFENKVTVAPDYDCTLYAKYNNLYIPFNNGGISDGNAQYKIITEPGTTNKVLHAYTLQNSSSPNIEIGSYDEVKEKIVPYSIKPSTKYTVSYRVKMKGGDNSGVNLKLNIGSEDLGVYPDSSKYMIAQASFTVQQCKDGTDWVNVSHTFETNDTLYYERVNFTYMNHLYIILNSVDAAGSSNSSVINMYIDDLTVIEHTDKIPEGAVAVYYETNGSKINPSFGYAGEKYIAPQNPTAQGGKFLGWYTDKSLTKPFTSTTFPSSNITLYAKWEDAQWIVKFDTYSTTGMSGRYNLTKEGDNNVLRYDYEQGKASSTAAASAFARATLNTGMGNEYSVVKGAEYTIKFRIKVLKEGFKEGGYVNAVTHVINNTWIESVQHDVGIAITQANDEWVTMEGKFVAAQRVDNANYLSIAFSGDYTALIDDIEVSSAVNPINIYGSNVIYFDSNGGPVVSPISGDPGDEITLPKPAARAGYSFKGWYTDKDCTKKFTDKTYSQEKLTLYAGWVLGSFTESFESLPVSVQLQGIGGGYKLYDKTASGYNAANVNNGATSIFRDGATAGTKAFTICRDAAFNLEKGEQYTISFYVKPTNVTDANGVINLIGMANNMSIAIPESTDVITNVGTLKANEWQKVSYTFTANSKYVGISTTPGNDMYMDNFTVQLNGYTGSPTGDESVSPFIILSMIVLAAGAIMFTSKKVFAN